MYAFDVLGDPVAAANSPQAQEFSKRSVHAWAAVVKDSGTATPEQLAAATEVSLAQFAPRPGHPTRPANRRLTGPDQGRTRIVDAPGDLRHGRRLLSERDRAQDLPARRGQPFVGGEGVAGSASS